MFPLGMLQLSLAVALDVGRFAFGCCMNAGQLIPAQRGRLDKDTLCDTPDASSNGG